MAEETTISYENNNITVSILIIITFLSASELIERLDKFIENKTKI